MPQLYACNVRPPASWQLWIAADVIFPAGVDQLANSLLLNAATYGGLAFLNGLLWPTLNFTPGDYAAVTGSVAFTGDLN